MAAAARREDAEMCGRWLWCWSSWLYLFVVANEFDIVDVEGDRGQIEIDGVVGVAAEDALAGGYLQPAEFLYRLA